MEQSMATYTHFEVTPPLIVGQGGVIAPATWIAVMGSSYSANTSKISITNSDGTLTLAHGSFTIVNGIVVGGTIASLERTSGATVYEKITGTSVNAMQFVGASPADKLGLALTGADNMVGYSGNDLLNGYGDVDHMTGGAGDDTYVVDSGLDVVTELVNQGNDTVMTNVSLYTLGANVERLVFTDTGSHVGIGNGLNNQLWGNTGQDVLNGLDGDDYFDGSGGGDTFVGGKGDDSYVVKDGDTVTEQANEGLDIVYTGINNYVLPTNVENLYFNGQYGQVGFAFGNELNNSIYINGGGNTIAYGFEGNDVLKSSGGSDTLNGNNGNDTLIARSGNDTLTGGAGDDTFFIGTGNHIITDFGAGAGVHDRIDLGDFKPSNFSFGQNVFRDLADVLAHATQNGANTVIDLGAGNSLTLQNVQKSALHPDDFIWSQAPKDFKGDTVSDILWHNSNGSFSIWDNGQIGGANIIADNIATTWHVAGSGDFDGNGKSDILLHNNDDGEVLICNNGDIYQDHIAAGAGVVASSWHIADIGDFDGNGQSDILWRNDNGAASIWNNGDINKAHIISGAGIVANSWHIAGTGDFDSNGRDDILWKNDNGSVSIWDDGDINKAHIIGNGIPDNWHIAGVGDFDANGHSDILWHNDNGNVSIWDNGNINQAHIIANGVDTSWHIADVGDYDGNRQSDILWHNDNGNVSIWDNGEIAGAHIIANGVDTNWHIV
jgi:Ca2+-binding RTX toxin-like protein